MDDFYESALAFWVHAAITVALFVSGHWVWGLLSLPGLCQYTKTVES